MHSEECRTFPWQAVHLNSEREKEKIHAQYFSQRSASALVYTALYQTRPFEVFHQNVFIQYWTFYHNALAQ